MDFDALDKAGRLAYFEAVSVTHWRRVSVQWFRRSDGSAVGSLTNMLTTGGISGDTSRTPETVLACDLLDEDYDLDWSHGAHRKFRVRIVDSRFVPALDEWVDRDVFTGPVWSYSRQGALVSLVVEGPEEEALGSVRVPDTFKAKTRVTSAIRTLLTRAGAEKRDLRIPNLKRKLPRDVTVGVHAGKDQDEKKDGYQGPRRQVLKVGRKNSWWQVCKRLAGALDRDLFGDGSGVLRLESPKSRPEHRLDVRHLVSLVNERPANDGGAPNVWLGFGHDPKGPRDRPHDRVELPKRHPASANSQRWNGADRDVVETLENQHWRKKKDVTKALRRRRDQAMREQTVYEVEALPVIPWVRGGSLVSVPVAAGRAAARATSWDLPLGPGADPMRIGVSRRRGWSK